MTLYKAAHAGRIAALQGALRAAGLDAALLTDEANVTYFTGYAPEHFFLTRSRLIALIVPAAGATVAIVPSSHRRDFLEQTGLAEARGYEGLQHAPVTMIGQAIRENGAGEVGAELGGELRINMTTADFDTLRAFPHLRFRDASALIWRQRLVKSAAEVGLIERACTIGELAFARTLPTVRAGDRERDLAARLAAEVALAGGRVAFLIVTSGSDSYHRSNGAPRDRALASGDFIFVDLGVRFEGYHADFNRCLVVGEPAADQRALQERIRAVSEEAGRYLIPGVAAHEVYARVLDDCRRADLQIDAPGRIGHGIGLGVTEPPHISAEDGTMLEPGIVVTIEPALQRSDGLYCAECLFVVEGAGGRRLNRAPSALLGTDRR